MLCEDAFSFEKASEEQAYWLGFLMADGYVHLPRGRHVYNVALKLAERDKNHVERFAKFVGTDKPLYPSKAQDTQYRDKVIHGSPSWALCLNSNPIAMDVMRYGVIPHKTGREVVPTTLVKNRDFWRGMVDGDGTVCVSKGVPRLQLVGSKRIIEQFIAFTEDHTPPYGAKPHANGGQYLFMLNGKRAIQLARALYENCSIALPRKHATALRILKGDFTNSRSIVEESNERKRG
jgi:hypothetical protein